MQITKRDSCRLCNSKNLKLVLKLAPTPIGDAYITKDKLDKVQECHPVDLYLCKTCGLLQLLEILNPDSIYRNYIYHTSDSLGLVRHFESYTEDVLNHINPPKDSLVIDIGSNDGSLLRSFKNKGMRVLGIDPALSIAQKATESGIETLPTFFSIDVANKIRKRYGQARIVTSNNTFANVDNLIDIVNGIRVLIEPDGVFVFETGYLLDLVQKCIFDNIYHEHLSYFSVNPLLNFFKNNGMKLIDVKRIPAKGGSLRCIVKLDNGLYETSPAIKNLLKLEKEAKIHKSKTYIKISNKLLNIKNQINELLREIKKIGMKVAGYGASVGATTVLYNLDINKDKIIFIVDDNQARQGLYSPGLHIPVLSPKAIYDQKIEYVLILAWQYTDTIINKHQKYLNEGGHFINFLPKFEVIGNYSK